MADSTARFVKNRSSKTSQELNQGQEFAAQQQDKSPEDRATEVHKLKLCPRKLTLYVGEEYSLIPLALNRNEEVVHGARMAWSSNKSEIAEVSTSGAVTAIAEGNAQVIVQVGNARAQVNVDVRSGVRRRVSDFEWDLAHSGDCDQPESSRLRQDEKTGTIATISSKVASDTALETHPEPSLTTPKTLARPASLRGSISSVRLANQAVAVSHKNGSVTHAASATKKVLGGGFYLTDPLDGSGGDPYVTEIALPKNATGSPRFAPVEESQASAAKTRNNLANYNYNFIAPVLSLGGREIGVGLALTYNSRLWSKDTNGMTFNYNKGFPAAGWAIGYGRLVPNYDNTATGDASGIGSANSPGNYLYIQADGTRIHLAKKYDSASGLWSNNSDGDGYISLNPRNGKMTFADGTLYNFAYVNNRLLPTTIRSRNGGNLTVVYRTYSNSTFKIRWAIDYITDSLGRVITFNYDSTTPTPKLISITGPDQSGATRTYVKLEYQDITLQYNFSVAVDANNNPTNGQLITVVRRIYYPATGRGYLFDDFSSYGMPRKISVRKDMTGAGGAVGDGTEIAYTKYYYTTNASDPVYGRQQSGALNDAPQYDRREEWWQGKTDDFGNSISTPNAYNYSRTNGTDANGYVTEVDTVTYPTNQQGVLTVVTTTSNDSASLPNLVGKVLSVERKQGSTVLNKIKYTYLTAPDGTTQIGTVEVTNDGSPAQTAKTTYDYGSYGRVLNVYEYGFTASVQRRTRYQYSDDVNHIGKNLLYLMTQIAVFTGTGTKVSQSDYSYDNYTVKGGMETYGLIPATYPPGHTSTFDENNLYRGNVTGVTSYIQIGGATISRYTKYDIFGNVVEADVNCCQVKTYKYKDDFGNAPNYYSQPMSTIDGRDGITPFLKTKYVYDFNTGLVTSVVDASNLTTGYFYDSAWRVSRVNLPSGAYTLSGVDKDANGNDQLAYSEQVNYTEGVTGKTITSKGWFNGAGQVLRSGSGAGSSPTSYDAVETRYDGWGRVLKQSNPYAGNSSGVGSPSYWTTSTYDLLSRVTVVTLPDNQTVQTTFNGSTVTVTDQVSRKRQSVSDGLGRLTSVTEQDPATGSLTWTTSYTFDELDNLKQVNQNSQTRTFVYDALSRLTSQTTPEAGTVSFTYADSGDVLKQTDARNVETHTKYDALNRPLQMWYTGVGGDDAGSVRPALPATVAATTDVTIAYNNFTTAQVGNGQVSQVTDGAGTETYAYDSLSRLSSKTRVVDSRTYQTQYLYNTASQATTLIYPSGKRVRINHDTRGRMNGLDKVDASGNVLANYVTSIGYNTTGQVTNFNLVNGVNETYNYSNDRLQLTSQTAVKGAGTLLSLTYGYAASAGQSGTTSTAGNSGQVMSVTGTVNSQNRNQSFTYDNVGRLLTAGGWDASTHRRFSYDRWGNRTGMWNATSGGTQLQNITMATTSSVVNNRIASVGSTSYQYDASGNLTNDGAHSYQYDGAGRLANVDSGATASFSYDANNWRVKKTTGGVTIHCVWEGGQVIAEYNSSTGALISEYLYAGGRMVAREQSGVMRYYHADRLSTRLTTDASGVVVGTQDHLPFGEDVAGSGESEKHRFTNYERDSESNTDYAINRQHQFTNGRFMQPDVIAGSMANPQTLNRYTYVLNDPINLNDPLGLYEGCAHQAMSEYIGKQAGLSDDIAVKLGEFAGDGPGGADSDEFKATSLKNIAMPWKTFLPIHFPNDSTLKKYGEILRGTISARMFQAAGFMMHAFEDGHGAHKKWRSIPFLTNWPLGHTFGGHRPDRIIGDQKFIDVANELFGILTGDPNAKLTPKQIGELIDAIVRQCGNQAEKFKVFRPRTVGERGGARSAIPSGNISSGLGWSWNLFSLLDLTSGSVTSSYEISKILTN